MKERAVIPPMDYLGSEEKLKSLLETIPNKREKERVSGIVKAINEVKGTLGLHQAAYVLRMADSFNDFKIYVIDKIGPIPPFWPPHPELPKLRQFNIGADNLSGCDPDLGNYTLVFNHTTRINTLGSSWEVLEPKEGGFTLDFLDGLPNGSSVFVWLNWDAANRIGKMAFDVSPTNVQQSTGSSGPDFTWIKKSPSSVDTICCWNNDDVYRVHFSALVHIVYY